MLKSRSVLVMHPSLRLGPLLFCLNRPEKLVLQVLVIDPFTDSWQPDVGVVLYNCGPRGCGSLSAVPFLEASCTYKASLI